MMSWLDHTVRRAIPLKFFYKGFGKPESLKRMLLFRLELSDREKCIKLVDKNHQVNINKKYETGSLLVFDGHFTSPFPHHLPGLLPKESEIARFQMILPKKWKTNNKPVCIMLPQTGDHSYVVRRQIMSKPLAEQDGIGSILLEMPFYGSRKPPEQKLSHLQYTLDLFVMGGALILECLVLGNWLEREGYGPLGLYGVSLGGYMAALAASNWPKPIPLVSCLSWSTASSAYTQGALSKALRWNLLKEQYSANSIYKDLWNIIQSPEKLRRNSAQILQSDTESLKTQTASETLNTKRKGKFYNLDEQTRDFMAGLMDHCTHLGNYSVPVDPSLATFVVAKNDQYIPRDSVCSVEEVWPGCKIRYINGGHLSASVAFHIYRQIIKDTFDQQMTQYDTVNNSQGIKLT